jgi:hypothetical protein
MGIGENGHESAASRCRLRHSDNFHLSGFCCRAARLSERTMETWALHLRRSQLVATAILKDEPDPAAWRYSLRIAPHLLGLQLLMFGRKLAREAIAAFVSRDPLAILRASILAEQFGGRASARLIFEIDVSKLLSGAVRDDKGSINILDRPRRREARRSIRPRILGSTRAKLGALHHQNRDR